MKKLYAILGSALLALPVMAQEPQLPNAGFEDGWGPCTPWTSNNNKKTYGETCTGWTISHVSAPAAPVPRLLVEKSKVTTRQAPYR